MIKAQYFGIALFLGIICKMKKGGFKATLCRKKIGLVNLFQNLDQEIPEFLYRSDFQTLIGRMHPTQRRAE